jgi:hypothetical protein
MPEDGMFMQQRLFLSLGTIESYSPEPLKSDRQEAGYTKLKVCPEKEKTGSIDV